MGQRVGRSEGSQRHRGRYGLIELTGIAESANESVMGLDVCGIGGYSCAKCINGLQWRAGGKQGESFFRKRFCGLSIGRGHGFL